MRASAGVLLLLGVGSFGCSLIYPFDYEGVDGGVDATDDRAVPDARLDADVDAVADASVACDECDGLCLAERCVGIASFALGETHTCVLTTDGRVYCIGSGTRGENGSLQASSSFIEVEIPGEASALSAGVRHNCAIADGGVWCWGRGNQGQLGDGAMELSATPRAVTLPVGALPVALGLGANHTCILLEDATVYCGGFGGEGQLGQGPNRDNQPTPVEVMNLPGPVTAIEGGGDSTCALIDGAPWCWGDNDRGQLGLGDQIDRGSPAPIGDLSRVSQIVMGSQHSCAVTDDGRLFCFGAAGRGQIGHGPSPAQVTTPMEIRRFGADLDPSDVAQVATSSRHTCARREDDSVWCWGSFLDGRLGVLGEPENTALPSPIGFSATNIRAGYDHTCGLSNGLFCWGSDSHGQSGGGGAIERSTPFELGVPAVQSMAAGNDHTCLVAGADPGRREVLCFGRGGSGQLGRGSAESSAVPVPVEDEAARAALVGVDQVSAGAGHTCALAAQNLYCWGSASFDQLGLGPMVSSLRARRVLQGTPVGAVDIGGDHSCAIGNSGRLLCWGRNTEHQVDPTAADRISTPTDIIAATSEVVALSAGTCARGNAGVVRCWGSEIILGGGGDDTLPGEPTVVRTMSGTERLYGNFSTVCALTDSLTTVCWGLNSSGQLGVGLSSIAAPIPVSLPGSVDIAIGREHVCVIRGGEVLCAGANEHGQLGDGTFTSRGTFEPVSGISGATAVVAGGSHTCALAEGTARCWGLNTLGQLGDRRALLRTVPSRVSSPN
ncbi:MAG: RCC1 repeat-containing protein [Myxococcota bacterium]